MKYFERWNCKSSLDEYGNYNDAFYEKAEYYQMHSNEPMDSDFIDALENEKYKTIDDAYEDSLYEEGYQKRRDDWPDDPI